MQTSIHPYDEPLRFWRGQHSIPAGFGWLSSYRVGLPKPRNHGFILPAGSRVSGMASGRR